MKRLILCIICLQFGISKAQESTQYLFDGELNISGFGGVIGEISLIKDRTIYSVGGGGGMLINQKAFIGGYGRGNVVDNQLFRYNGSAVGLEMGHGGLWFGYNFLPKKVVHFGLCARTGWGGIGVVDKNGNGILNDGIFVLTPQADLAVNVLPFMKVNMSIGYRAVTGANNPFITNAELSSPTGLIGFYFGWFGE
jgi:hypothetical protein